MAVALLVVALMISSPLKGTKSAKSPVPTPAGGAASPAAPSVAAASPAATPPAGATRAEAENRLRARVPGVDIAFDERTGSPAFISSTSGFLTGTDGEGRAVPAAVAQTIPVGDPNRAIKAFLQEYRGLFGYGPEAIDAARATRDYVTEHNGMRTVVWQQQALGIPVFEAVMTANVTARGELINVASKFLADPVAAAKKGAPDATAQVAAPAVPAEKAVAIAAAQVGDQVAETEVTAKDQSQGRERRQHFEAPRLNGTSAAYTWVPTDASTTRLCWDVILTSNTRAEMFRVLVDAGTGRPLVVRSLTERISNASYRVFTSDSPSPFSPGHPTPLTTQPPLVSPTLVTTMALDTTASPNGWIDDGVNETLGNNVDAHTDTNADNLPDLPRPQGSPARVFDFTPNFTQDPSAYRDAAVTNLFYTCNWIHDLYYELGFTEAAGNFQTDTFGRGGVGNDAVQADAQDGSGTNNANFSTPPDGSPGRMQMYVFPGPSPARDGDLDREIVIHEYTHGLSNRLVGGGVGISALQTRGMGEGWSDFYGLAELSEAGDDLNGNYAAGGYATYLLGGLTQNYYFGIRRYPYSTNLTKNPLTFKDIDPLLASSHTGIPRSSIIGSTANEVHNVGEVWCVTLWEARANLVASHGFAVGNQLILQLVTDGMKLSPANPTFTQARDAILQADLVDTGGANANALWAAFAKRGLGASAVSPPNSTTTGVVESFDIPNDLHISPVAPFTSSGTVGGPFTPASQVFTLTNSGATALNWSAVKTQPWVTLSAASGSLAAGASTTVTATINALANSLAGGNFSDTVTFTNVTDGATQARGIALSVSPPRLKYYPLDTNPGWPLTGQWAFGHPTGLGGTAHGGHDPANGATGSSVLGVNLAGDYSLTVGGPYYATIGPLDLSSATGTKLQFQRWLNSDFQPYATATIEVSTNGSTWTQIWNNGSAELTASAWTKVQYDISAIADRQSTVYIRWGYQIGSGAWAYSGWNIDDIEILGTSLTSLSLSLPAEVTEGDGTATGTISTSQAPAADLVVALISSNPSELVVPASVTIPAGQASATFPVTILDDGKLDGTQTVMVGASVAGYTGQSVSVAVHDNETASLSLNLPASVPEGTAGVLGTVSVSAPVDKDVAVTLSSSDTSAAQVAPSVTIQAGATSAEFGITVVDDTRIDGTQQAVISAVVTNWTPASAPINVTDNESSALSVTLPPAAREGDPPQAGTVTLSGTLTTDLVVDLVSSDPSAVTVPATVTVPAGQLAASFSATIIDDTLFDGPQAATITASADGFSSDDATVTVADNDAHHFVIAPIASPQVRNAPFAVQITAKDASDATITNFATTIHLVAAGNSGAVGLSPATAPGSEFVNGVWTGNLSVTQFASQVVLSVDGGGGPSGSSNAFDVGAGSLDHFSWDAIPSPQTQDTFFGVTITAQDAGNNTVGSFTGTAALAVKPPTKVQVLSWITYADTSTSGEYQQTKKAISTFFTNYEETSTTVTDSAQLAAALVGKQVFLVPEQENSSSSTLDSLGIAWASVLNNFVNGGGTIIVCSNTTSEHLLLTRSSLLNVTPLSSPSSISVTKTTDTPLNNAVAVPFTGSYLHSYSTTNGTVSLQTTTGEPVVISRAVGAGRVILIGTDYYTLGTGMDRVVANAVALAIPNAGAGVPIDPQTTGNFVGGVWSGNVDVLFAGTAMRLSADAGAGHTGDSNTFAVQAPSAPPATGGTVFSEPFEDTTLGAWWTITGTSTYRTQLTTTNTPHGGAKHLTMDSSSDGTYARNEATLTVNLAGRTGVVLSFWAKSFSDEADGPPPSPFVGGYNFDGVAISADGMNWYEVQGLRSLSGTYAPLTVDLDAAIAAHGLSYNSTFKIRFNQYDNYGISTDGIAIDDILITAKAQPTVTVSMPAQATEGAGALTGTVTLPVAAVADTTVALSSSANAKVSVPASVTVPAGQVSANFTLTVLDNPLLDGNRRVTITATPPAGQPGAADILIIDNDVTTLGLAAPSSTTEGATGVTATVSLGAPPAAPITLSVTSSNPAEITAPATVTFLPGQTSATIPLTIIDDTRIDGTVSTTITVSATGWTPANATVAVLDNESKALALSLPASVAEGATATGSVSLSGTLTTPLSVSIVSATPSQLTVTNPVVIPTGATSASFTLTGVDDTLSDGTQNVSVSASAPGFTNGSGTVAVLDNEVHHFSFATIAGPKNGMAPFSVTVTARDTNDVVIASFSGSAALSGAGDAGVVSVAPTVTGNFSSGSWTGNVSVNTAGTNIHLSASAGSVSGVSNPFDVLAWPVLSLSPTSLSVTVAVGAETTRTLTLQNTGAGALNWTISSAAGAAVVSAGPAFDGGAVVNEEKRVLTEPPPRPDAATIYTSARNDAMPPGEAATSVSLASALSNLNLANAAVLAAIPNRYAFSEGVTGTNIGDGGNDMYDGGNFLNTNLGSSIPYSDNVIATSAALGTGGQYFTHKYNGLFVFVADVVGLSYFEITGNLGADGSGSTDSAVLSVQRNGVTYRGFVKRVYAAGDPSVNHLIIVADNGSVTHETSTDTNNDYHRLTNLTGVTRIYDLLYAGTSGAYIDNTAALGIMNAFLDAVLAGDWVTESPSSGTVAPGGSQAVSLTISAAKLAAGNYTRTLLIDSNDPLHPQSSLPITLQVLAVPTIAVTPAGSFSASGSYRGPFTGTQVYTINNPSGGSVVWTASKAAPWLTLSTAGGTLAAGASTTVTAGIDSVAASKLASGSYTDTITFTNVTNGTGNTTRPATLTINPAGLLDVTPTAAVTSSGNFGGPFTPASHVFTLTNIGDAQLDWTATETLPWLTLSSTSGTLSAGASTTVTATINASTLEPSNYSGGIDFANTTTGRGNTSGTAALTVTFPAPVFAAEPPFTGGTSNTVSWSAVPGATAYEVQCSTDPDFITNVTSSGPITETSHTFAALADGSLYHYRVHARRAVPVAASSWSQTTQAEFATDTAVNVSASAVSGSVVLANSQISFSENFGEAGSAWSATAFSDALGGTFQRLTSTSGPNTSPSLPVNQGGDLQARFSGSTGHALQPSASGTPFINGSIEAWIAPEDRSALSHGALMLRANRDASGVNGYAAVIIFYADGSAKADFSRVTNSQHATLSTWFYTTTSTFTVGANENIRARFSINGSTLSLSLWRVAIVSGAVTETPIPFFNGGNTLTATDATYPGAGFAGLLGATFGNTAVLFDDVSVAAASAAGYAPSGSLTSPLVTSVPVHRWGQLQFTGSTAAVGTSLHIDVLDAAGALLAANVPSGTDLGTLPELAGGTPVRLRANLATTDSANTPALQDWSVSWQAAPDNLIESAWSDAVTSSQDASPPAITITSPSLTAYPSLAVQGTTSDFSGVATLTVSGFAATSSDSFQNWVSPAISLTSGLNLLVVTAADNAVPPNSTTIVWTVVWAQDLDGDSLPGAWESDHGLDPADATGVNGRDGDLDFDGISNYLEYALDLDPARSDADKLPAGALETNASDGKRYLTLSYRRRLDAPGTLHYVVEISTNLADWNAATGDQIETISTEPVDDGIAEQVKVRIHPAITDSTPPAKFVRLRVQSD